ncbi:hypothetical protein EDD37DRAFT_379083 [Exophiala viscosa]|uniref:uncharacterized protein n=1 Tax=Exophiala viscosa TaxID=2486360 RepID=UPI0021A0B288|nr:hypothetical protein EDD37DRAFT_379083 [Exophiala viscosa]
MSHRCQGAEFAGILINECIEERSSEPTEKSKLPDMGRPSQRWGRKSSAFVGDETASVSSTKAEAILLSSVVRNIDSGLANDVSEKIDKVRNSTSPQTVNNVVESVEAPHSVTPPVSDSGEGDTTELPRALIKYMAFYKEVRVLQSATMFSASTRFRFTDILHKTATAASNFAAKRGQTALQAECRATILDSQDRKGLEVEIDMEGADDWETVASIVSEWWLTQKKRHIVVNLVARYT